MAGIKVSKVVKLTRSCESCVKTKRKCSLSYPICDRCRGREIICIYRNVPLGARPSQYKATSHSHTMGNDDVSSCRIVPPDEVLAPLLFRRLAEPPCIVQIDADTNRFMLKLAKRYVVNFGIRGGNVFVHSDIATSQLAKTMQSLCRQSTSIACRRLTAELHVQEQLGYLLGALTMTVQAAPDVWQILACVQCLTLIQVITLFILRPSFVHRGQAEKRQRMLYLWTRKLWMMAPSHLPSSLTQREAFLLAESVRRTIIVSSDFQALYHSTTFGWIEHNIFLDSLPFERRAALWDMSEEEFRISFANAKQEILSWRELADMFDAGMTPSALTSFETMLLVGAKSKPVVEARLNTTLHP